MPTKNNLQDRNGKELLLKIQLPRQTLMSHGRIKHPAIAGPPVEIAFINARISCVYSSKPSTAKATGVNSTLDFDLVLTSASGALPSRYLAGRKASCRDLTADDDQLDFFSEQAAVTQRVAQPQDLPASSSDLISNVLQAAHSMSYLAGILGSVSRSPDHGIQPHPVPARHLAA